MDQIAPHRARSLPEFGATVGKMLPAEDIAASIAAYRPRPSDVVITPYGKCGTTWLQQIFHTLRTRGDFDFDDISRVVPWIETAAVTGLDIDGPQRAEPRGFKSHLDYGRVPKGARYIVSFRNPYDACVSFYHFMVGWFIEPGAVSLEEFAHMYVARAGLETDYWHHLVSWWKARDNENVLVLAYEQMNADPEGTVRKVAAFCGIPLDDELLALTLERSSFDTMLKHKDKFDDLLMRTASETRCNLPPGGDSAKVRKGGSGQGKAELTPTLLALLDEQWAKIVAPATGFADYAALQDEIARQNG
jgi:hypothetical protein